MTRQQSGIVGIARRKSASLGLGITASAQSGASLALDDCMVCFSVHCRCQSGCEALPGCDSAYCSEAAPLLQLPQLRSCRPGLEATADYLSLCRSCPCSGTDCHTGVQAGMLL